MEKSLLSMYHSNMSMNKIHFLTLVVFGTGLASLAILPSHIKQDSFATAYGGDGAASPAGLPQGNMTGNMSAGSENVTVASPVSDTDGQALGKDAPTQVPIS
jgi:hypothetical protein